MNERITLQGHLESAGGAAAPDLAIVVARLAAAGKVIASELARAALVGQLGTTGGTNVHGEAVKKLDIWANHVVVKGLEATGLVSTLVSEEIEAPVRLMTRSS